MAGVNVVQGTWIFIVGAVPRIHCSAGVKCVCLYIRKKGIILFQPFSYSCVFVCRAITYKLFGYGKKTPQPWNWNWNRIVKENSAHIQKLPSWSLSTLSTFGNSSHLAFLCDCLIYGFEVNGVSDCTWGCQSPRGGPVSRGHSCGSSTAFGAKTWNSISVSMRAVKRSVTKFASWDVV